jgi:hypothetical protein
LQFLKFKQWQHYIVNRLKTIKEVKSTRNVYPRFKGYEIPDGDGEDYDFRDTDTDRLANNIRRSVRKIEEMGLIDKTLQKCVRILKCDAMPEEVNDVGSVLTRYSFEFLIISRLGSLANERYRPCVAPSTPTYIDVAPVLLLSYAPLRVRMELFSQSQRPSSRHSSTHRPQSASDRRRAKLRLADDAHA